MNTKEINQFQITQNSEQTNNTMVSNSEAYTVTQSEPENHGNSMIDTENEFTNAPVTTDNEQTVIPSRKETPNLSLDHETPETNTVCTGEDNVKDPTDEVYETSVQIENSELENNSYGNLDVIHVTNSDTGVQTVLRIEKVYSITQTNSKSALADPWETEAKPANDSHAEEGDINHELIDRNDDIEDLPEDIKAELTVQAEYYQSKSASGQVKSDLDQCENQDIRNPESYNRNPQASEIHASIKTEPTSQYEENECRSVSNSNSYFGSESSMFSLSNSSTNLEELSQGHVIEEVTVSDELNDLGLDERYFQDIAQEQINKPNNSVKQTNITNGNGIKMKKNSTCKKVTFIDASSISKITSLWAKTNPSPKPPKILNTSLKKRGRPKKIMSSTLGSSPSPSQIQHTTLKKRGRPKTNSGPSSIPSQIDASSISDKTSFLTNNSPSSEPQQNIHTSATKRGRPKNVLTSTSESSLIPSHIDASSILKVTSFLANKSPSSEPQQNIHTSPKKRGRPKKIINSTPRSSLIPSHIDASNISKVTSIWASPSSEPQLLHTIPRKRGRPKKIMSSSSSGMTNLVVNALNYKKNNLLKKTNEAKLLSKFKITPCRIELTKLKMDKTVVQLNVFGDIRQNVVESLSDKKKCQEQKLKDIALCNTGLPNQRNKSEKKTNHLKEEKNCKIAAMRLKLEKNSEPDGKLRDGLDDEYNNLTDSFDDKYISLTDGMDDEYISDVMNLSEDEYTPTKPDSLKKAFVKSSKGRKVNKDHRRPAVKRKIELTDTTEGTRKKLINNDVDGGCRIGRPPVLVKVECHKCDFASNERELMKKHYKKFHAIAFKFCQYCNRRFKSQECLLEHEAFRHTKEKIFKCPVDGCSYASSVRTDLSRHQSKHATEKSHICQECGWTTRWRRNLRGHRLMVHTGDEVKKFKCRICNYHCKRSSDLKQHMFRHTDEKPIECATCGFCVKTNWELKSHMFSHSDEKPHRCTVPGCTAAAKTNADILKHMRKVHTTERNFVCSLCSKAYKDQQSLNKHHVYAHVQTRLFKCDICNKAFKLKAALRKHIHLHSGIKPFSCSVCQKKFATRNNMSKHMATHDFKSRPFRCPLCPYGAKESCHLLAHIGTLHGDSHCYFCELCKKPFERHSKLLVHYQRMHKSDLTRITNPDQFDLALVKMEMELSQGEPESKPRKRKLKQTKSKERLEMKIKEEPLDGGYETHGNHTEEIFDNPEPVLTETCMIKLPDTFRTNQTADVNEMNQDSALKDDATSVNHLSPNADEITLMIDTENAAQNIADVCKNGETGIADNAHNGSQVQLHKSVANGGFNSLENNHDDEEDDSYHKKNRNEEIAISSNEEPRKELVVKTGTIIEESRDNLVNETGTLNGELANEAGTVNEKNEPEILVTRNGSSFILALYNSLRLPLATKGFDFNYQKTGKKPKAWFMDTGLMNKKDARRHIAYQKRSQQMPSTANETKTLKDFLKQRSEKRHASMMKRNKQRDANPNRGVPGRSKLYNEKYSLDVKREKSTNTHKYTPENPDQKDIVTKSANNSVKKATVSKSGDNSFKKAMITKSTNSSDRKAMVTTSNNKSEQEMVSNLTSNSDTNAIVTKKKRGRPAKKDKVNYPIEQGMNVKALSKRSTNQKPKNTELSNIPNGTGNNKRKLKIDIKEEDVKVWNRKYVSVKQRKMLSVKGIKSNVGKTPPKKIYKKKSTTANKVSPYSNKPSTSCSGYKIPPIDRQGNETDKGVKLVEQTGETNGASNDTGVKLVEQTGETNGASNDTGVKLVKQTGETNGASNETGVKLVKQTGETNGASNNTGVKLVKQTGETNGASNDTGVKLVKQTSETNKTSNKTGIKLVKQTVETNGASNDAVGRFQIPVISNFIDDTLVMEKYENIHRVLGGITPPSASESDPRVGQPSSTLFTGDDKKYLSYNVNVNRPETCEIAKSGTE